MTAAIRSFFRLGMRVRVILCSLHVTSMLLTLCTGAALAAPGVISPAVDPSAQCLDYDAPTVKLAGTIFYRIYFGPPGYGETPTQDARERATLILLDAPICVTGNPDSEFESNVIVIQLAAVHIALDSIEKKQGLRVTLRGKLYHRLTGHHRTAVLMDVDSLVVSEPTARAK